MTVPAENKPMPPAKLEQKKYVVAFLDFLGASEKMTSPEESDKFLQQINRIYDFIKRTKAFAQKINFATIDIRIFSDNIILAKQVDDDSDRNAISQGRSPSYYSVFTFSGIFMFEALKMGLFVRGAITIGSFVINSTFVYGEALVNAYRLENLSAIYPRIIIDQRLINFFQDLPENEQFLVKNICDTDFDGERFLSIFNGSFEFYKPKEKKKIIETIGKNISAELLKNNSNAKNRQKYYWLMKKFNMFCENSEFKDQRIVLNDGSEC